MTTEAAAAGEPWHALEAAEALRRLGASEAGLDAAEAARRLDRHGPNLLRVEPPVAVWRIVVRQLRSLVVALLAAAGVLALAVGDTLEAASILAVLGINLALGLATELGARRAMASLERLQVAKANVRRGGRELTLDAALVVPGDLLVLEAGAAVAADARLLQAHELRTVEAALTGESFPVDKSTAPVAATAPLPERTSMVYKSTLVAAGGGLAVVTATGEATELGDIRRLTQQTRVERTPLEARLDALGRRLIGLTLALAALVSGVGILRGGGVWLMVETGLALAIAAIPEGLPVVSTITLAIGMHRMARRRALVRRLPAVETLGSATVICTDKTGTLTAGEMTVVRLYAGGRTVEVTGGGYEPVGELRLDGAAVGLESVPGLREALTAGMLANRATVGADGRPEGDPTEGALLVAGEKLGLRREVLRARWLEVGEVPFSSERMWMATYHRRSDAPGGGDGDGGGGDGDGDDGDGDGGGGELLCVKGAPARLLGASTRILGPAGERPLTAADREAIRAANESMAGDGLRVLALAGRRLEPTAKHGEAVLDDLVFFALAGIADPPAAGVAETIAALHAAGVRTIMLTGDQGTTAAAVGRKLGIVGPADELVDGRELADLGPRELAARVARVAVFSRVSPADKLHVVDALHQRGEIVAMLGDGVNDAPALRRADIGVAMGRRGTEVARDAADLVLADDRFQTVAAAVEEGRVVFDNIRKFIFYLFSCNLSEILVVLIAVVAGLPLPLLPLQVLWLNMITDVFPALALGVEPAEPDVMRRPPRSPQAEILSRRFLLQVTAYGVLLTAVTLGGFVWALEVTGVDLERARTMAFMILALGQLLHVLDARSPRAVLFGQRLLANRWVWAAIALTVTLQLLAVYAPGLARLLQTVPLAGSDWLLVLVAASTPLLVGQTVKALRDRRIR